MPGMTAIAIEYSPRTSAGEELQPCIKQCEPAAVFPARVEVSHFAQFGNDVALVHDLLVALQLLRRVVVRFQRFKDRFRREHPALDCRVNSFQPLRVEKTSAIAGE